MTIIARWVELERGFTDATTTNSQNMKLARRDDVDKLIERLNQPFVSEAHLEHQGRALDYNELLGRTEPDHQVTVGVWHGFGYLEFLGDGHHARLDGDPASPEWYTSSADHFPAGSGVDLATLAGAVAEFLATTNRPTCVRWRDVTDGAAAG